MSIYSAQGSAIMTPSSLASWAQNIENRQSDGTHQLDAEKRRKTGVIEFVRSLT